MDSNHSYIGYVASQFAMAHLRNLSDSGVYESLELRRIKSAQTQVSFCMHLSVLLNDTILLLFASAFGHLVDPCLTSFL